MFVCDVDTEIDESGSEWSEKRAFIVITSPLLIDVQRRPITPHPHRDLLIKSSNNQRVKVQAPSVRIMNRNRIQSVESNQRAITNDAGIADTQVPQRSHVDFHTKRQASSKGPLVHRISPRISGIAAINVPDYLSRSRGYVTPQRESPSQ